MTDQTSTQMSNLATYDELEETHTQHTQQTSPATHPNEAIPVDSAEPEDNDDNDDTDIRYKQTGPSPMLTPIQHPDDYEDRSRTAEEEEKDPLNAHSKMQVASKSSDPASNSYSYLKSTLKKKQRAWVDPFEPAIQDTFYHKQIETLRPTFDIVHERISGVEPLNSLFVAGQTTDLQEEEDEDNFADAELEEEEKAVKQEGNKFGMWDGVIARNLLNIFGVIMFLRVGFMVGQAGIIQSLIIIGISATVVMLTALSMSAICTNGTILGGGAYYMISRALGPSIGGAIGILFSVGNMCACSLYLIGFAETLVANLYDMAGFTIIDGGIWDVRIWSNVVLMLVLFISIVGLGCVVKTQLGLLVFILVAIALYFIGSFYRTYTNDLYPCVWAQEHHGIDCDPDVTEYISFVTITPKGWTNGNFAENLGSGYQDYTFWTVLGIFFPAVTGIMAGANISGEIKNPGVDIPKGTMISIVFSTIIYMLMAVFVGAVTDRYELLTNEIVMAYICVSEWIILIGIYAATLSSAIASLVGAPRILQAVATDNLFPFKVVQYFGVLTSKGEPLRGYFLTTVVAIGCNLIGELNAIAPLISQFFMLTYFLVNVACFGLAISKSPGWRPSFKYFNRYTALFGALLCLVIMFLLNWVYALVAILIACLLFSYVYFTDPEINWGAAPQARRYYDVYTSLLKLRKTKQHIRTWRPSILVLTRDPIKKPQLMLFTQTLQKSHGPLFYATVHTGDYRTNIRKYRELSSGYLPAECPKNAKGFYETVIADSLRSGVQSLIQLTGTGSLSPNTMVIGFKAKWQTDNDEICNEYVQILRDALVMGMGVMVVVQFKRINWFLDQYAPPAIQHDIAEEGDHSPRSDKSPRIADNPENYAPAEEGPGYNDGEVSTAVQIPRVAKRADDIVFLSKAWEAGQGKQTVIDVWWMIDDGGLCMLIPYIMKRHQFWQNCKLRMLMVAEEDSINTDISAMRQLMAKFRLPYEGPLFVPAKKEPHRRTIEKYEALARCRLNEIARPQVIKKWLILSELLYDYSRYAGLNVVTMPIPTKQLNARAYMALLEMLAEKEKLPPTIIMRGNGESTLTFYSE
eukprot:CAMPEP_0197038040 /NCGR_PEP_ID=MMETSP1384-20130603/15088_1 /TAXON_ID=29189 /ORGANISM="Ammonia sp." /LENGTH=1085 /DNA_ID=CAMNT_0042468433 /DNA_START=45 /DNA_END=3302 /DNA_ORIENTATION=+